MSNTGSDVHDLARRTWAAQQSGSGLIPGSAIAAKGVDTAQIADDAIEAAQIADNAVGNAAMADAAIDSAEIVDGAVDPVHIAADTLGVVGSADHGDTSPVSLMAADANTDRAVIIHVTCTETIAGDNDPTWTLGETDTTDKFAGTALFASNGTAGDSFTVSGTLSATKALIVTLADGGDTTNDAGAFSFVVIAAPIS